MTDLLSISADLPELRLEAGEPVVREGDVGGAIWVLVSGALLVRMGGLPVNTISEPGAVIGEISVLLGAASGATVETTEPSCLRYAADGHAFLSDNPQVMRIIAVTLAQRLNFVTTYLADLKFQYGDAPGLSMVSEVLARLAERQHQPLRPGSTRDPDPDY